MPSSRSVSRTFSTLKTDFYKAGMAVGLCLLFLFPGKKKIGEFAESS